VAGLTLPLSGSTEIDGEAAELFVDRARLVRTEIGLDAADVLSVAAICRALDGNPLALELAAARVRIMSVQRIASELSDRFRLLANKRRVGPSRHATLRASMDWSYQLLSEDERTALRRLAVFSGRFDLAAAEAVCGFAPIVPTAVLELLSALVDKSLVQPEPLDGFRLLETVRAYGREH